jgi:hypothetical protein
MRPMPGGGAELPRGLEIENRREYRHTTIGRLFMVSMNRTLVGRDYTPEQRENVGVNRSSREIYEELRPALAPASTAATPAKSRRKKAADAPGQKTLLD